MATSWAPTRAFAIGLAIYGVGSLTTALSPTLAVLLVGWSGVEGFGAVLVVPAIAALTAATYEGRDRALAYALLGGIAAIAVAAGPLIGGWVTTEFTWCYVFAAETVVVILILFVRRATRRAATLARGGRARGTAVAVADAPTADKVARGGQGQHQGPGGGHLMGSTGRIIHFG